MSNNTDLMKTLFIATGLPATYDETGYEALTWAQVKGVVDIGEIGGGHATIEVPDLETGRNLSKKGAVTGSSVPVTMREIAADAGQVALKAACQSMAAVDDEYSFYTVDVAGVKEFWAGTPHSWKRRASSMTSYAGFTCTIEMDTETVAGT